MHARNVTNLLGIVVNVNTNNSDDICSNTSVPCRQAIAAAFCSREKIGTGPVPYNLSLNGNDIC